MKLAGDVRSGNIIKRGNDLFLIVKCEYYRAARQNAIIKMKLKNMETNALSETSYTITDKLDDVRLDVKKMQYLYATNDAYSFMDQESFDQVEITKEDLGDAIYFILEEQVVDILFYEGKAVSIDLPKSANLKVTYAEEVTRGDSSGKVLKPATVETGLEVQVPYFIKEGEIIIVDTTTKEYVGREQK
ncbi:MAG: elongation factor P [Candidatus Riflemargulisbacteria bacterium]|jgi:elongation factor P